MAFPERGSSRRHGTENAPTDPVSLQVTATFPHVPQEVVRVAVAWCARMCPWL